MSDDKTEKDVEITEAEIVEDTEVVTEKVEVIEPEKTLREKLLSADHWLRFLFMILFALILNVAGYVLMVLVVISFVWGLVAGENNEKLRGFGSSLSHFIYQILRFLTYNTETKPFPFSDWPASEPEDGKTER